MRKLTKPKHLLATIFILTMSVTLCGTGRISRAQQPPAQNVPLNATSNQDRQNPNPDLTQQEVARMDQFLDDHKNIDKDLEKNPSLATDNKYLDHHKDLKHFFDENPRLRGEFAENPNYFMHRENRLETNEGGQFRPNQYRQDQRPDATRDQLAKFDRFLDSHREIAEQVRKNPSLLDNREFVENHPELQTYFRDNPGVRDEIRQNPNAFVHQEDRFDANGNGQYRDRDAARRDAGEFDRFLDSHREIAEQVRKDPSLLDNREFVENHPELQTYFRDNPGVRDEVRQDPNAFVHQDNRFDVAGNDRDRDATRDHAASFGEFLGGHPNIARDVSNNPAVVKDHDYVENHRELGEYLNAHPEVRNDWMADPQGFVKTTQQYGSSTGTTGTRVNNTPGHTTTNGK